MWRACFVLAERAASEGPRSTRAVNHTRDTLTGMDRRPNKSASTVVATLIVLLAEAARQGSAALDARNQGQ